MIVQPGDRAFPTGGIDWTYDDGGRVLAGFRGDTGDCVTRAIAIASRRPYAEIYAELNLEVVTFERGRIRRGKRVRSSARTGVFTPTIRRYLALRGWSWTPTMLIGSGCRVHLRADELPATGAIIVALSRHVSAVVDGVVRDTADPSRAGMRCVYGIWRPAVQP